MQSHEIAFISTIFTLENWLQIMKPLLPGGSQILNYHYDMIVSNFCYAVQKWTMDKILICFNPLVPKGSPFDE